MCSHRGSVREIPGEGGFTHSIFSLRFIILCYLPETHRPAIQTLLETSPNKIPSHYDWEDLNTFSYLIDDEDKYRQLQSILRKRGKEEEEAWWQQKKRLDKSIK